jgi:hypothetical protein
MDIVADLLKQVATGDNLSMIAKSVGGDVNAVQSALRMGLPVIMGSMASTASTPTGLDALTKMLTQGGSGSPLDNLGGFLTSPEAAGGSAMASSLFGYEMSGITTAIAQKTGLRPAIVSQVITIATPIVAGYVGKMFVSQKMDTKNLTSLLGDQSKLAMTESPDAAVLAKQFLGTAAVAAAVPESSGGIGGFLKKLFG